MSTARFVPETWELTGDDARRTLTSHGRKHLLTDAFRRLRVADGFSHARSLAFTMALVLVQAIIAIVGLATALRGRGPSGTIVQTLRDAAPGPAGELLTGAVDQAGSNGVADRYAGLVLGLVGALITGTTMLGQMERALNRLYGIEQDRPSVRKYGQAFLLTVTAGLLATGAFVVGAFGRALGNAIGGEAGDTVWTVGRWPLTIILVGASIALLFRWSPRRRQPAWSWLAYGASVSVALWVAVTLLLDLAFHASNSFGETYGPLAGLVALLLWSLLSSIAILYGAAVAAQLEAVRAGDPGPQDPEKVSESEPEGDNGPIARLHGEDGDHPHGLRPEHRPDHPDRQPVGANTGTVA
jgi:YihY family inner membrane protein